MRSGWPRILTNEMLDLAINRKISIRSNIADLRPILICYPIPSPSSCYFFFNPFWSEEHKKLGNSTWFEAMLVWSRVYPWDCMVLLSKHPCSHFDVHRIWWLKITVKLQKSLSICRIENSAWVLFFMLGRIFRRKPQSTSDCGCVASLSNGYTVSPLDNKSVKLFRLVLLLCLSCLFIVVSPLQYRLHKGYEEMGCWRGTSNKSQRTG
jgi:hypothetical protein